MSYFENLIKDWTTNMMKIELLNHVVFTKRSQILKDPDSSLEDLQISQTDCSNGELKKNEDTVNKNQ